MRSAGHPKGLRPGVTPISAGRGMIPILIGLLQLPGRRVSGPRMKPPLLLLLFRSIRLISALSKELMPSPFSPGVASFVSYLKENNSPTDEGVVLLDSQATVVHNARNFSWRTSPSPPNSPWCSYSVADDPLFAEFEFTNASMMPIEVTWYCEDEGCDHTSLGCESDENKYIFFIAVPVIMLIWAAIFKICDIWPSLSRKWRRRNFVPASYFEMGEVEEPSCEETLKDEAPPPPEPAEQQLHQPAV